MEVTDKCCIIPNWGSFLTPIRALSPVAACRQAQWLRPFRPEPAPEVRRMPRYSMLRGLERKFRALEYTFQAMQCRNTGHPRRITATRPGEGCANVWQKNREFHRKTHRKTRKRT